MSFVIGTSAAFAKVTTKVGASPANWLTLPSVRDPRFWSWPVDQSLIALASIFVYKMRLEKPAMNNTLRNTRKTLLILSF